LCGRVLNLFLDRSVVSRNVYGGTADTNLSWSLLGETRSCVNCEVGLGLLREVCLRLGEARSCVNGEVALSLLGEVGLGLREAGRSINGEVGLFLVFGLEALTVSTFGQIKLGVVVTARRKVDANVGLRLNEGCLLLLVMMMSVREIDFEVGVFGFVLLGSVDEGRKSAGRNRSRSRLACQQIKQKRKKRRRPVQ